MKRKVFSLLMLCLFAFLGMANAQPKGDDLTVTPNPIDLGYRPIGAWMRPLDVQLTNTGVAKTITNIEADKTFFVIDANLPGMVSTSHPFNFTVTHGEAEPGVIQGNLIAMTEGRKAYIFDIMAVAYNPIAADVVETAPTVELPFTATVGEGIYDNYLLPGDKADGKDVVYKMNIENDILFSANVTGANGKVALYKEDFNGQPGPGANNSYGGQAGGGAAPFEAQIGEVTTASTGYFPFYNYYNYSIAENLFLASELTEAGVTTAPMGSLSWNAKNETGYEQKNISIWMANVSDEALTTTSHVTSGMTLVYTGNVTPVIGWNEFVFNEGNFAWDGVSNVLICVQRNNGSWNSAINWTSHSPGFVAQSYKYQDGSPYDMATTSYTMSTTSSARANIIFKSVGRTDQPNASIEDGITVTPGVYYVVASSTSDEFTVNLNSEILPAPEPPYDPAPADGETNISCPVTLAWTFGDYTTGYRVLLGTTYPPTDVVVDWTNTLASSVTVNNLYNNKNYFWQVEAMNSNGVTAGPIWGFTTTLNIPQNLASENPKIYEGDVLHLTWAAVNDRSYRGYNLYQDDVKINDEIITANEYNVAGLTYNTTTGYTFNVTAVYDEGESDFSNDLNVKVSGNGTVSGKVAELDGTTGIANATVSFEGVDEFNRPATYTFTTANNGTYGGTMLAGNYTAMVVREGYQPVAYDGTIHITYNTNTPNINFVLQEILYPVGEVIAEEMSDTQVKVYWSQNIMSEIIEDFETGDFSAFDWQNDATYPWSVVTTSPYEGSYCMKSGNDGVNSSTSAIQVSVEISRDGLMSFYHKISSESTYDKGYFYIDGNEKCNVSGSGSWQMKEYAITAGVHTFKWAYTKDSSVSSNDDCYYVDCISFIHDVPPVPEGSAYYDFETGIPSGWTTIDANNDGITWVDLTHIGDITNYYDGMSLDWFHGGSNAVISGSYYNGVGALSPDDYLVSPQVTLAAGSSISFWVAACDPNYPADHFGVFVSTGSPTNTSDFVSVQEWTLTAKKGAPCNVAASREGKGDRIGTWYNYTVDLNAYAGHNAYIAFRHFNCTDQYIMTIDDVTINDGSATTRAFDHYNIYRAIDGDEANAELISSVTDTVFFENEWGNLEPGVYKWGVSRVYEGNRGNREVIASNDFEDGTLGDWTTIDADGDGYEWYVLLDSNTSSSLPGHNNSDGHVTSASYQSVALNPDNYLVSPQVTLGGTLHFYACAQDASWPSEHFGVAVSTTTNNNASAFTMVQEWTMNAKGGQGQTTSDTRSGNRTQGNWYEYTVDLSAYSGQGYVAIRHFGCTDWFRLNVDDIEITSGGSVPPTPPTPPITGGNESEIVWSNIIEHNMFVSASINVSTNSGDDVTGTTVTLTNTTEPGAGYNYNITLDETGTYTWENMRRGIYDISINLEGFTPITESVDITDGTELNYTLVEIINAVSDLYVSGTGWALFGNVPAPVDPGDPNPPTPGEGQWYYYDNGTNEDAIGTGGGQFWWGVMFPAGSYTGNMVTKVSAYDYMAMNGDVTIYNDGATAPSSPVGNTNVTFTGSESFVEFEFAQPVVIDPSKNVWVVFFNSSGATYPAAVSANTGDANGRWVSLDGSSWNDLAGYGLSYTFMVRAYIASGAKGEVTEIAYTPASTSGTGTFSNAGVAKANRTVEYYNVKLDDVLVGTTTNPFFQFDVEDLVEGETYTASVQKVYTTGESEWTSFDWVYTACDNFEGLQAEPTAEWQGEDVVLNWVLPEGDNPTPPDPPTPGLIWDFESNMSGWTTIDANNDGITWVDLDHIGDITSYYDGMTLDWYHGGSNAVISGSYYNGVGALSPDDYLVSPQVTIGSDATFSFWVAACDPNYPADHFGVFVSTNSATNPSDFTSIQEWTLTAKKGAACNAAASREGKGDRIGTWYNYTVDLSAYAGQNVYIAFRHFNCTDQYIMTIDDAELGGGGDNPNPPTPGESWTESFENGIPSDWATIDADGDGYNWQRSSVMMAGYSITPHTGEDMVSSQSYNGVPLTPDNYLVTPQVTLGGTVSFWACAQDASYAAEHFGLAVSTGSQTNPADFTTVQEWTMTAKGVVPTTGITRSEVRATGNYYQFTVNLSNYAGQTGYIAIRHFGCTDMFYLNVDDVEYTAPGKGNRDDIVVDFESGIPSDWTTIDANNDGITWVDLTHISDITSYYDGMSLDWYHGGSNAVISGSYYNGVGALSPDDYLVSPQVSLVNGSSISFWVAACDPNYPADHFGVFVSTGSQTNPSDFVSVQEWTLTAKKGAACNAAASRDGKGDRLGTWYNYTVDLSAYAGNNAYIAFRHFNCTDQYIMTIDDVTISAEGGTGPTPPDPPTPGSNVRGVEIFRNGEWIAEVPAPAQTYTDIAPEDAEYYEIRVVYNGNTADYTHYTMSCPEMCIMVEDPCSVTPDNLTGNYEWVNGDEFGALINWTYGDFGAWLYYDAGESDSFVGESTYEVSFEWANMYPAADIAAYAGTALTKVAFVGFDASSNPGDGIYTLKVYLGGDNAPATLVHTQDYNFSAANQGQWIELDLTTPVAIDGTQNLWIAMYNDATNGHLRYPAAYTATGTGGINGRWCCEDNGAWEDINQYLTVGAWILRGYVTNAVEGGKSMAIDVTNGTNTGNHHLSIGGETTLPEFNFTRSNREPVSFNVYRNGSVIGNVPYANKGDYEYFDQVAAGNYQYQVTAVYADCESDFALTPDGSQNYVEVDVTSVTEHNDTRIYPNPTTGIVTIEAGSMNHITVVNALGQVLYDANVNGEVYQLNLGQFQAGVYMVRIATENGVSVKRVTVAK